MKKRATKPTVRHFTVVPPITVGEAIVRLLKTRQPARPRARKHRIVIEREANGTHSAWVEGLPVYVTAGTREEAKRAIREALSAHLQALREIDSSGVSKVKPPARRSGKNRR